MIEDYINYIQSTYENYDTDSWYGEGIDILEALGDMSENLRKGDIQVFRNKSIDIFGRKQLKITKDSLGVSEEEFKELSDSVSFLDSYDPLGGDDSDIQFDTGGDSDEAEEYVDDFDESGYPTEESIEDIEDFVETDDIEDSDDFDEFDDSGVYEDDDVSEDFEDDFGSDTEGTENLEDGYDYDNNEDDYDNDEDDLGNDEYDYDSDEDDYANDEDDFGSDEDDDRYEDTEDSDDYIEDDDDFGDEGNSEVNVYDYDESEEDFEDSEDDFDESGNLNEGYTTDNSIYENNDEYEDFENDDDFEDEEDNENYNDPYADSDDDDFEDDDDFDESGNLNEQYETNEDDFSDTDDFEDDDNDDYVDPSSRNSSTINSEDGRLGSRQIPSQIISKGGSSADKTAEGLVKFADAVLGLPKKLKTALDKCRVTDEDDE